METIKISKNKINETATTLMDKIEQLLKKECGNNITFSIMVNGVNDLLPIVIDNGIVCFEKNNNEITLYSENYLPF